MRRLIPGSLSVASVLCAASPSVAVSQADSGAGAPATGAPVLLGRDTLFLVKARLGPFTPEQRAAVAAERIQRVVGQRLATLDSTVAVDNGLSTDVMADSIVLFTVTDEDADSAGTTRALLAAERAHALTVAVRARQPEAVLRRLLIGAGLTLVATVLFLLVLKGLTLLLARTIRRLRSWRDTRVHPLKVGRFELFSSGQITEVLVSAVRMLRVVAVLLLGYAYLSAVFSFFPWTRGFASTLLGWVVEPLRLVGVAFLQFIPKLFFIVVIIAVTRFVLKVIRLVFHGIASGRLELPNFPSEWADPTYKLVRLFVLVVALIVVFPYLPGSQSDAFKGVSVFVGILLSLGSTSATANMVAGVVLTYMRPFRVGDRVRIADTTGDVLEKTLLVTRVRTIHHEDITIPNAMVLASHIVNFSSSVRDAGLILHTGVTIGYDAPWRTVHQLLLAAAGATDGILEEPEPYILQTSLDDSYVSYQLNAYTDRPNDIHLTYARLHENIQDQFNAGGIEILSPQYAALRDGNKITIPDSRPAADHHAPAFRVQTFPSGG
ncbi:MAG TPA: mechanosensitive ion channel domain-containing protein [Gemmatimonadales bacterium]|nr:mechanosensitive ion channel domain-containing protein [Gemmatimonadales bacterium]